jgi:cobalamin biosynthesis protein CbiG
MATYLELNLNQANDEDVELTLTQAGAALDLGTASALELFLKPHRTTADTDPAVTKLTVGSGIAVTDEPGGVCVASIPAAALAVAGLRWWRIDAVITGKRKTALFGLVHVADT